MDNKYIEDADLLIKDSKKKKGVKAFFSQQKYDGWKNVFTGLGTGKDKRMHTRLSGWNLLADFELTDLWVGDGTGKRIIEVVADDMVREWIEIEGDEDNGIKSKMDELGSQKAFNFALYWKRLFGGAIIFMGIDDGGNIYDPVNEERIKSVDFLKVYTKSCILLTSENFNKDKQSKNYGNIEYYTVCIPGRSPFNIHSSRCLEFKGDPVPEAYEGSTGDFWYWGTSCLQAIWDDIRDFGANKNNLNKILFDFVIGKAKLKGLAKMLAEGEEKKIIERMNIIDLQRGSINTVMLDADGEDYSQQALSVAGLAELFDRLMMFISGVTGIPVTRLFGRSPAGQNSTGESDLRNYYDMILPKQNYDMKVPLLRLATLINLSEERKEKSEELHIKFNKLFQMTETEEIQNRKNQSEIDQAYVRMGVLDPSEIRESRFENGWNYGTETTEDPDLDLFVPGGRDEEEDSD